MEENTASIIMVDGTELPTPYAFGPVYKDYDSKNSGRSEDIAMTRDIVRTDVRSMAFSWRGLTTPELRQIISAIKKPRVKLTFFDINQPADVQYSTMSCYADPTREPKLTRWDKDDPERSVWEFSTTFVEYCDS